MDYVDGSILTEHDLDLADTQLLFLIQEAVDELADAMIYDHIKDAWDAGGKRITNLGEAIEDTDAVTYAMLKLLIEKADDEIQKYFAAFLNWYFGEGRLVKPPVNKFEDLAKQYPKPEEGWTVFVYEDGTFYVWYPSLDPDGEGRWVPTYPELCGGGGIGDPKDIEHNSVSGIQGGRVEDGRVVEAYHLSREEYEKLPNRPTILSPVNGAENVNQVPQVIGSAYLHRWDVPMWGKHIQIATDVGFATVVYELEGYSGSPVFQVPLKPDNTPYLTQDTEYFARIRYQDVKGRWSHWSAVSRFKTMKVFPAGLLLTPVMLIPSDGMALPRYNPVLAMSSPKVAAGVANFDKADWQISTDRTFATTLYSATDTPDLAIHRAQGVNLATAAATDFFARGRQKTATGEATPWAVPARFSLLPEYDNPVFGFRRVFSTRLGLPLTMHIGLDGEPVYIPKSYFDRHPLYAFEKQKYLLGKGTSGQDIESDMVFIPPVWEKCNVYDNADGDMVIDLWFSATPQSGDGWFLDPAFAKSPYGFLHGAGLCHQTVVGGVNGIAVSDLSKSGTVSIRSISVSSEVSKLNTLEGQTGWHPWSIYERRLIADLAQAEYLTMDMGLIGLYATHVNSPTSTDPTVFYRGMACLWSLGRVGKGGSFIAGWGRVDGYNGKVTLQTPNNIGGGVFDLELPFPVVEASELGSHAVTEIYRGQADILNGMDAALLGVPKAIQKDVRSPFALHTRAIVDVKGSANTSYPWVAIGGYNDEAILSPFGLSTPDAYIGAGKVDMPCAVRVSKWM